MASWKGVARSSPTIIHVGLRELSLPCSVPNVRQRGQNWRDEVLCQYLRVESRKVANGILLVSLLILGGVEKSWGAVGGTAFSFGGNSTGETGLGTTIGNTLVATPMDTSRLGGRSIAQVAAGIGHGLLLADDGNVFSFGNNRYGSTGLGGSWSGRTLVASPINTSNLGGRLITQVAVGSSHSLLLADDGSVFSFGDDRDGQIGRSGNQGVARLIDTSNLGGRSITQVDAGVNHSLLLADDGSVFSFGSNHGGQTGLRTRDGKTIVATPIDTRYLGGRSIKQVSAGGSHSLLLADDGSVFSFGFNNFGQTGLGTTSRDTLVALPIDMSNLGDLSITQVDAKGSLSLLLADDGSVFSFGSNTRGELGRLTTNVANPVAMAIDVSNLGDRLITKVAAGFSHSLLLADDGSVFSFGNNRGGQTGLGFDEGETLIASPIGTSNLRGMIVTDISAGGSTSLLVAVPEPASLSLLAFGSVLLTRRRAIS